MNSLKEIKRILEKKKDFIKKEYLVKEIGIFGSYVRNEQRDDSDLDILIELEKPISLLKIVHLENYLSDILEIKIDIALKDSLKPRIGEFILREVIYV